MANQYDILVRTSDDIVEWRSLDVHPVINSISNVSMAAMHAAAIDPNIQFVYRTEDDVIHTIPASEMIAVATLVLGNKQAVVSAAWAHKDNIKALNTSQELRAYDITANCPV